MGKRANILFFFSDQHRGDWMPYDEGIKRAQGVEELELHMPVIRGMMDRGTTFTMAISPAPVCAPARACLAAGKRYKNCRVYSNNVNYDSALKSFYGYLNDAGYYVCGTGKFDLNKADLEWGDGYHKLLREMGFSAATDSEGKMDTIWAAMKGKPGPYGKMLEEKGWLEEHEKDMMSRGGSDKPTPLPDELYADNWICEKTKDIIKGLPEDKPWFVQVNFSGPHDPWDVTEKMKAAMAGRRFPEAADCEDTEANQGVRQNYAAMIENIDGRIGEIIEELERTRGLENTLIVYAADHGEMMGDHNMYGKQKPEQGSIHIPLVIDASRVGGKAGVCITTPVELQDLAATFLDYAGVEIPEDMESKSLKAAAEGKTDRVREYGISELVIPNARGMMRIMGAITDGKYKLIMKTYEYDRLYDIENDPFECSDLARELPEDVERLRKAFGERGQKRNPVAELYAKAFHAGA